MLILKDIWKSHTFNTVNGLDYCADQDAVILLTKEAPDVIIDLEYLGVLFFRLENGKITQRAFDGHIHKHTCYVADKTGHAILHELVNSLHHNEVTTYYVMQLIFEEGNAKGIIMYRIEDGKLEIVQSKVVIFATGGYKQVFNTTFND